MKKQEEKKGADAKFRRAAQSPIAGTVWWFSSGERNLAVVELSAQVLFVGLSGAGLRVCGFVDWR